MMKIVVDSQSNRLFHRSQLEQNYDQRGGLCQAGKGDVVITTNPINPEYLAYWEGLKFDIPHLLTVGPFDPNYTLSELIQRNQKARDQLRLLTVGREARLEFFCIEETERELASVLDIAPHCNFDVSIPLSRKHAFKEVCDTTGLPTAEWKACENKEELTDKVAVFLENGTPFLIKSNDGTGVIACGGMKKIECPNDLAEFVKDEDGFEYPLLIEKIVQNKAIEVALHWEIENGKVRVINLFQQLSTNFAYAGTSYPVQIPQRDIIETHLHEKLAPFLLERKAIGYFCCDILIDDDGSIYWIDFNPRKGAILYVYDMVCRASRNIFDRECANFWHEHFQTKISNPSFQNLVKTIAHLTVPCINGFAIITNPGVIPFNYADITGVSFTSVSEAKDVVIEAKRLLQK